MLLILPLALIQLNLTDPAQALSLLGPATVFVGYLMIDKKLGEVKEELLEKIAEIKSTVKVNEAEMDEKFRRIEKDIEALNIHVNRRPKQY